MKITLWIMFPAIFFLAAAAGTAWRVNNPKANDMTFWTYFSDAICFKSLPQFQENAP